MSQKAKAKPNWVQHAWRERPGFQLQRQAVALAALGVFVAILMGALYLAQSSSVSTLGRQIEELIIQRNQLEQQNEQFRAEIAELRSVPRLLARAQELGFRSAAENEIEYLYVQGYIPSVDPSVVLAAPAAEALIPAAPTYDESFVGWLQQQWDQLSSQFDSFARGG